MTDKTLFSGIVHETPNDLAEAIINSPKALTVWQDISAIARNEFICWATSAKKPETRQRRIRIAISKLSSGERRPCCWPGCVHRLKSKS